MMFHSFEEWEDHNLSDLQGEEAELGLDRDPSFDVEAHREKKYEQYLLDLEEVKVLEEGR
jgi:hypothetical protein